MHKRVKKMNPEGKDGLFPAKVPHNLYIAKKLLKNQLSIKE